MQIILYLGLFDLNNVQTFKYNKILINVYWTYLSRKHIEHIVKEKDERRIENSLRFLEKKKKTLQWKQQ